ncbi:SHOCT domain-containing protein [bacterium 1xD42-67]|nr:SHOCT domain-containing protein [bacterium 1xD42-67]
MVNRCILAYTTKEGKEVVWTIPYEEIIGIMPVERKERGKGIYFGELILTTTTGKLHFVSYILKKKYAQFVPAQAVEVVLTLVTKYKQAKYAAQQGTAAPQYSQQTPPPKAPQGEAPQERSQWSAAQLDTAQRTAARLTAALQASQAPQPPKAEAPAAPPAAAGLSAETVEALKQLKDLLDAGILTQEEFDAKKKQLLGL